MGHGAQRRNPRTDKGELGLRKARLEPGLNFIPPAAAIGDRAAEKRDGRRGTEGTQTLAEREELFALGEGVRVALKKSRRLLHRRQGEVVSAALRRALGNGHQLQRAPQPREAALCFQRILFGRNDPVVEADDVAKGNLGLRDHRQEVEGVALVGKRLRLALKAVALQGDLPDTGRTDPLALATGPALEVHHGGIGVESRDALGVTCGVAVGVEPPAAHGLQRGP